MESKAIFFSMGAFVVAGALLMAPTVQAKPRPPRPPLPEGQLASWRFDSEENALLALNVNRIESWSGFALRMAGKQPSLLAWPEVTTTGRTNRSQVAGTLRFWFSPD